MICPDCLVLLPHDLAHVQEHEAICSGNSCEVFLAKFASLADSIEQMAKAGNVSR